MKYLFIFSFVLLFACSDDDETVPDDITNETPADTTHLIQGLINGKVWFSDSVSFTHFEEGRMYLTLKKDSHSVTLSFQDPQIGIFPIDTLADIADFTASVSNGIPIHICSGVDGLSFGNKSWDENGMVEVTKFDETEKVISGNFETTLNSKFTFLCNTPTGFPEYDTVYVDTTLIYQDFIFTDVPYE